MRTRHSPEIDTTAVRRALVASAIAWGVPLVAKHGLVSSTVGADVAMVGVNVPVDAHRSAEDVAREMGQPAHLVLESALVRGLHAYELGVIVGMTVLPRVPEHRREDAVRVLTIVLTALRLRVQAPDQVPAVEVVSERTGSAGQES
jgi:hypothetical protein